MDNNILGLGILQAWKQLGIQVIKFDSDNEILYIIVPENSQQKDVNGIKMCGKHLADRIQQTFRDAGSTVKVKYKIDI